MKKKKLLIPLSILAGTTALAAGSVVVLGETFYNIALKNRKNRPSMSVLAKDKTTPLILQGDTRREWCDEVGAKDIAIKSFDGYWLHSYIAENPGHTDKFAIICHGYTSRAKEMGFYAEKFYKKGFSCLLPSARCHDSSEGKFIDMGWLQRLDLLNWISYLNEEFGNPQIVLMGVSMGAAAVMMASGENLPPNVKCAIEDCGYSSIKEQFEHTLKNMVQIPKQPIMFSADLVTSCKTGIHLNRDGYCTEQLKKCKIPMLFIHGTNDRYVPFWMLDKNYEAHPGIKEKFVVTGGSHASNAWQGGDAYWDKVMSFTEKFIK